jgi:hypothetical protein
MFANHFLDLYCSLSNRELAGLTWIFIIVLLILFFKTTRSAVFDFLSNGIALKIVIVIAVFALYQFPTYWLLEQIGIWSLKGHIAWFLILGLSSLLSVALFQDDSHFKSVTLKVIGVFVFFEFLINFHSFSFIVEFILAFVTGMLVMLEAVSKTKEEFLPAQKFLTNLLAIFGGSVFLYSLFMTTKSPDFLTLKTLGEFLLPLLATIISLPFLYFFALVAEYELLFMNLNRFKFFKFNRNEIRNAILKDSHINLFSLRKVRSKFFDIRAYDGDDLLDFIKSIK